MKEYRIRYIVPTAHGFEDVHAVICRLPDLVPTINKICAKLKIIGVDERIVEEGKRMPDFEGWTECPMEFVDGFKQAEVLE